MPAVSAPAPTSAAAAEILTAAEKELFDLVNEERTKQGFILS